ncbi:MAG: Dihydroneopterin aldolase [uncultured Sulfurovum sp.]|uniref:dihydroneopterin aldolase n=1 Tax=uncultured Sulfurovum sp. TaxID=269237 RepID=A0A6S6S4M6_9BACT|nr:MAG: Dihydroneopterin aldolase [uncultured Sulfurovum sp.]
MTIHIEALTFECIIGILDFERITAQKVVISLQIDYEYVNNNFINYADIISLVERDMIKNKYLLLETALNNLASKLLLEYSQIQTLQLKIMKPDIISNAKVSLSHTFTSK